MCSCIWSPWLLPAPHRAVATCARFTATASVTTCRNKGHALNMWHYHYNAPQYTKNASIIAVYYM